MCYRLYTVYSGDLISAGSIDERFVDTSERFYNFLIGTPYYPLDPGRYAFPMSKPSKLLYWFRTDLRITDSPALHRALSILDIESFHPIWCFDPNYVYAHLVGLNRWSFLLSSMTDLSSELSLLNPAQKLFVIRGPPEEVLPRLFRQWGITHLCFEKDSNGYARARDEKVRKLAGESGVEVVEEGGRHLFDPEEVVKVNGGKGTMTLHQWQSVSRWCERLIHSPKDSGDVLSSDGRRMADLVGWFRLGDQEDGYGPGCGSDTYFLA